MRIVLRLATGAIGLLIVALVAFYVFIDVIAGTAIEKGTSYALGVDTHVGFVRIGILSGSFRTGGLKVENPSGFDEKYLATLGAGRIEVSLESLQRDLVEVPAFVLSDIHVNLERAQGRTNFGVILANLKRFESSGSGPPPAESGEDGPAKRFIVRELSIERISAHVEHTEGVGDLGALDIEIPAIRLRNIGAHNARGVVLAELTDIVMKAVFQAIAAHGLNLPNVLAAELRSGLRGLSRVPFQVLSEAGGATLEKLPQPVGDAVRAVGGGADAAGKAVEERADEVLKGLGGFFGGKKKDDE